MTAYRVVAGDCLASIAHRFGFTWQTLWKDPANSDLRALRKNPNILFPGDPVFIPVATVTAHALTLSDWNTFTLKSAPCSLRVRFVVNGKPLRNKTVQASLDGLVTSSSTDDNGIATIPISPSTTMVDALVDGWWRERFAVGHLDPVDTVSGLQARLRQLGLYAGNVDGHLGPLTQAALRLLQRRVGLPESAAMDHATLAELERIYGS